MKNIFIEIKRRWNAETPKLAKWIRNIAGTSSAGVLVVNGALTQSGVNVPPWFSNNLWWFIAIPAAITFFAGIREKKGVE